AWSRSSPFLAPETCQSFHNDGLPSPELRWVDLIFGSNLSNGFLFFQQLLDHLGFKAGCMLSFRVHALIVSCSPSFFGLVLWVHHIIRVKALRELGENLADAGERERVKRIWVEIEAIIKTLEEGHIRFEALKE